MMDSWNAVLFWDAGKFRDPVPRDEDGLRGERGELKYHRRGPAF